MKRHTNERTPTEFISVPANRVGFTLVELLVVIAIIGILVALLLPAVQAAREAARRMQCSNNLKQIALALHGYHDVHRTLPPGWLWAPPADQSGGSSWAWSAFILPYLEQTNLHDQLRVNVGGALVPPTGDPTDILLPMYVCPSDAGPDAIAFYRNYAKSNYPGVNGTAGDSDGDGIPDGRPAAALNDPDANGIFGRASHVSFADVLDGTSNTFAVGERESQYNFGAIWIRAIGGGGSGNNTNVVAGAVVGVCNPFKRLNLHNDLSNSPGSVVPAPGNSDPVGNFSSLHPGGAQFALCDGSVRFVGETIALRTYQNLANRKDGEVVGDY